MEGHDPIVSWELAISICLQPLSTIEVTTKERAVRRAAGDSAVLPIMTAAPRGRRGGSEIHRDPGGVAGRDTERYRQGEQKYRAGGGTTGNTDTQ